MKIAGEMEIVTKKPQKKWEMKSDRSKNQTDFSVVWFLALCMWHTHTHTNCVCLSCIAVKQLCRYNGFNIERGRKKINDSFSSFHPHQPWIWFMMITVLLYYNIILLLCWLDYRVSEILVVCVCMHVQNVVAQWRNENLLTAACQHLRSLQTPQPSPPPPPPAPSPFTKHHRPSSLNSGPFASFAIRKMALSFIELRSMHCIQIMYVFEYTI